MRIIAVICGYSGEGDVGKTSFTGLFFGLKVSVGRTITSIVWRITTSISFANGLQQKTYMAANVPITAEVKAYIAEEHAKNVQAGMSAVESQTILAAKFDLNPRTVREYCGALKIGDAKKRMALRREMPPSIRPREDFTALDDEIEDLIALLPDEKFAAKTFIITGWELRVKVDFEFVDCLRQIAQEYDAELCIAPCYLPDLDFLPPELRDFRVLQADEHFNENIFFKYVETHALASSPLSGWRGFSDKSAIIPGLIKELETQASEKHCKLLTSTGSIGHFATDDNHYTHIKQSQDKAYKKQFDQRWKTTRSQKKPTEIAREYIKPSALILHILDDKRFLVRYVTKEADRVHDLNKVYMPHQRPKVQRPLLLNIGDTHAYNCDKVAVAATLRQIEVLRPKGIVLNDFTDGCSVNHHEKDKAKNFHGMPSIEEEMAVTIDLLKKFVRVASRNASVTYYKHSNHDDFFDKILDAGERYWRLNGNYEKCVELQYKRLTEKIPPIKALIDFNALGVHYLDDKPSVFGKVAVLHGHESIKGRRAGFREQVKHYNYVSMNHLHSPAIWRNGICGGLTARKDMDYVTGLSGWLECNTLIHEDGSTQLLIMIDGIWSI